MDPTRQFTEEEDKYSPSTPSDPSFLNIKAFTWLKDSHGLYDYETLNVMRNAIKVESNASPVVLCRCSNEVRALSEAECKELCEKAFGDKVVKLASITCQSGTNQTITAIGRFFIKDCSSNSVFESHTDKLWLVVRSLKAVNPKKELHLKRGDVIKMGRAILKVKDYRVGNLLEPQLTPVENEPIVESKCKPAPTGELCRICHSEEHTRENPLLSICKCTGSLRFVHYKCLRIWLNYKLIIKKQEYLSSYYWKSFECEICKLAYPSSIKFEGTTYILAEINRPMTGNFIQFETVSKAKEFSRIVHVLVPDQAKTIFKLGRGHESDVKIPDISVSRIHAQIIMTEKGYILEDNTSKFGTLFLLPSEPYEVDPNDGLSIQVGRTMITLSLKQRDLLNTRVRTMENFEETKLNSPGELINVDNENNSDNVSGDEVRGQKSPQAKNAAFPKKEKY